MAHLITSADLEGLDLALHAIEDAYKYKLTIVPSGESGIDIMPPEGDYDKGDVTISMTSLKEHKSDVMKIANTSPETMRRTLSEAQYALSKEYYHVCLLYTSPSPRD